jgi:hypothetical protein
MIYLLEGMNEEWVEESGSSVEYCFEKGIERLGD